MTQMNEAKLEEAAEIGLDAACEAIQRLLGQKDGGVAAMFFSGGPDGDAIRAILKRYVRTEVQMAGLPVGEG